MTDDIPQSGPARGTLRPPLPAELMPLVAAIHDAAEPVSPTLASSHIAATAAVAAKAATASIDLNAGDPHARAGLDSNTGRRYGRLGRRRVVAIVATVATLAAGSYAVAALTRATPSDEPTISAGDAPAGSTSLATPSPAPGTAPPEQSVGTTSPEPDTSNSIDGTRPGPGASSRDGSPTTAGGPTTTVLSGVVPTARPAVTSTIRTGPPTTAAAVNPVPPGSERLIALGGATCGDAIRLATPGSWLSVAGTIADNCDAAIGDGTSVSASIFSLQGILRSTGSVSATVVQQQSPTADPFAGLPANSGGAARSGGDINSTVTLQPGYYAGPVSITTGGNVTLAPGVYDVPGFKMTAGATLSGAGVVIYNRAGGFHIDDCSSVSLSPPNLGAFAGFTIVQPAANTNDLDIRRGPSCNWSFRGNVYAPMARFGLLGDLTFAGSRVVVGSLVDIGLARISITA